MHYFRALSLLLTTLTLAACGGDGGHSSGNTPEPESRPVLELSFSEAPFELSDAPADFAADIRYGDGERNLFDIFLPDCDDPTPLVIYVHGGGFTGGDKSAAYDHQRENIRSFLQNCVAYASINYALLDVPAPDGDLEAAAAQGGVLPSLEDAARALQFMRYHFESLNIEPENVAMYGVSAGAGASLWLGTHDELAAADAEDPILRESTRIKAVGALVTQSTYDVIDWEAVLLPLTKPVEAILGGTDVVTLASALGSTNYLLTFLGITSIEQLDAPEQLEYRANIDMLELMDAGDAPIYTENFTTSLDNPLDLFLHHALHAIAIKERADEVGLESVAYSRDPAWPLEDPSGEGLTSFLMRHIL